MITILFYLLGLIVGSQESEEFTYFIGMWKADGKNNYEVWQKAEDAIIEGEAFKINDGNKHLIEKLALRQKDGKIVYEATVFDQNNAQTIPFILNSEIKDRWQFENPEHDFPTKIIYHKITEDRMFVEVLGNDDKGFSFYMDRQ